MVRFKERITSFLEDIKADTTAPQAARFQIPTPDPSDQLWAATLPTDLAPGVHVLQVRSTVEFGNKATANTVFEACEENFNSIEKGQVLIRDCIVLTAK